MEAAERSAAFFVKKCEKPQDVVVFVDIFL